MTGVDKRVQRCQLSHQNILYIPYIRILTPAVTHRHRDTNTSCHTGTRIPTPAVTRTQGYPHQLSHGRRDSYTSCYTDAHQKVHGHNDTHTSCHTDTGIPTQAVTRTQGYPHQLSCRFKASTPAVTQPQGYPHQLSHGHKETHTRCHTATGIPASAVTRTQGYPHQLSHGQLMMH